jgi:hypothetical protein
MQIKAINSTGAMITRSPRYGIAAIFLPPVFGCFVILHPSRDNGDVVSMLTRFGFKHPQNCLGGCNQLRIIPNPLNRPADGGTIHIQSTGHFAS